MSDPTEREATAKALRVFLLGIEDVLGKAGLATALRQANVSQYINHYPPPTMGWHHDAAVCYAVAGFVHGIVA